MSQLPPPGWYADPSGSPSYRWWDGQAWTAHTSPGEPAVSAPVVPTAMADSAPVTYGIPVSYGTQQLSGGPTTNATWTSGPTGATSSVWERNRYALITVGIVALYLLLAVESHIVMLGVMPILMSVRSWQRKEPFAVGAVIAAVVAVLGAIIALSGS